MKKRGMQATLATTTIQVMNDDQYNLMLQVLYFEMFVYEN